MKWVTWRNVGVDRMACAWLILRRIDLQAEFSFVPAGSTLAPENGEAFDIPRTRLSHHRGHCSFYTFLKEYKINDLILDRIAQIVDEADIVEEFGVEPAAYGLDLICRGIRRTSINDQQAIERGCLIYDALYSELAEGEPPLE